MDKYLKPSFAKPPFRLSQVYVVELLSCEAGKDTSDVASGSPRDEGRSGRCHPSDVSLQPEMITYHSNKNLSRLKNRIPPK